MKKRLLTVLLVAFVLCTMAINSFALTNPGTGLPFVLDYSAAYKAYPQYNATSYPDYTSRIFINGKCPYCNSDVTYVNYIIDNSKLNSINNSSKKSFIVGIYQTYSASSFPKSNFAFSNVLFNTECPNSNSNNYYDYWEQGAVYTWYDGTYETPSNIMIHRSDINTDILNSIESYGWYASFFCNDILGGSIGSNICDVAAYLFNNLQTTGNYESYYNRASDFILRCFLSSPYDNDITDDIYNNGYNVGYDAGYDLGFDGGYDTGYDTGYNDAFNEFPDDGSYDDGWDDGFGQGFDNGVLHGQDMTGWSFTTLFDSLIGSLGDFTEPFLDLGFAGITIGSLLGLCGVVYVIIMIVKIIRG